MDIRLKFIFNTLLGLSLGLLIGAFTTAFLATDVQLSSRIWIIFQFLGSGLMGVVGMGGTIVYDLEDWSLLKATLVHYICSFATMFALSELLGWYDHSTLWIVFIMFSIAYLLIWTMNYLNWKVQIRQLNKNLEIMQSLPDQAEDSEDLEDLLH